MRGQSVMTDLPRRWPFCIDLLESWYPDRYFRPRVDGANWVRHVYREYNRQADSLATKGKQLLNNDLIFEQKNIDPISVRFIRGSWDGGHDSDKDKVGIGVHVEYCDQTPSEGTIWKQWISAFGCCNGKSSADAEILAFVTLLKIIDTVTKPYSDKECHFLETVDS